jgi:hypothetical protein
VSGGSGRGLRERGRLVAAALAGSWLPTPSPFRLSTEELESIAPLLADAGSAGLAWRRVRGSASETVAAASGLHEIYRASALLCAINETGVRRAFAVLRAAGIEPILIKGWAIARFYPETGARPFSDIDLVVPPEQYADAQAALDASLDRDNFIVDVHSGCADLDDRDLDGVYARSELAMLGDVAVRVPSPEDHLRILCLHMLRHGARRPMWACDIAVALACRPERFDWDLCLGSNAMKADWVACAIGVAHRLLEVRVDDTPIAQRAARLPWWFLPAVLRGWGRPLGDTQTVPVVVSLLEAIGTPRTFYEQSRSRWDRPIQATVELGAPFNALPRLPLQILSIARRLPGFGRSTVASVRARVSSLTWHPGRG